MQYNKDSDKNNRHRHFHLHCNQLGNPHLIAVSSKKINILASRQRISIPGFDQ